MKRIIVFISILIGVLLIVYIVFISVFSLSEGDTSKQLQILNIKGKPYKIGIYHIPSSATTQSNIQVRKITSKHKEEILAKYDRYNFLVSSHLINDSNLVIIVKDTVSYLGDIPDTMVLKIKD